MNFKIGGDETTPNIKGGNTFFHNSFLLVKLCVKKKSQPKKTIRKTMNFDSTNWLKKKKSQEDNKCHNNFSIPLF